MGINSCEKKEEKRLPDYFIYLSAVKQKTATTSLVCTQRQGKISVIFQLSKRYKKHHMEQTLQQKNHTMLRKRLLRMLTHLLG